ncbi:hypothetical protein L873DRAFT_1156034 [Choiromyces venosus 120613-1]|uniref:Uncharacterized protein n=1 Tax=Choiromyces venosus 120613-1 TaxID=1336337 RepID=A0A3N4JTL2_9PEZI|nr:hypothetical protein L873DRAFT_1156034 [Choiromyces venosus 120613-1]
MAHYKPGIFERKTTVFGSPNGVLFLTLAQLLTLDSGSCLSFREIPTYLFLMFVIFLLMSLISKHSRGMNSDSLALSR